MAIDLIGTWQRQGETFQFTEEQFAVLINGQQIVGLKALVNGQMAMYQVKGNILILMYRIEGNIVRYFSQAGMLQLPYQVQGNTFIYNMNGTLFTLTRQGANQTTNAATSGIRPELVGKWSDLSTGGTYANSYMSSAVLTLFPDGTYSFGSEASSSGSNYSMASQGADAGTWTATDTTITLNSRRSGPQTYTLQRVNHPKNNDPMIVLNGKAYTTFYNRPPW